MENISTGKVDENSNEIFESSQKYFKEDFDMVKCVICGKEESSLLRVKHRELGTIKLCFECWEAEKDSNNLLSSFWRCDCCK